MKQLVFLAMGIGIGIACTIVIVLSQKPELEIESEQDYISGIPALDERGNVNAIIEIPAGTNEKWEVNKRTQNLYLEEVNGEPRTINYLSYPANYGMIPQTLLPENMGGDGDPLDVIVLGPAIDQGKVVKCRLIGILKLLDGGEIDDKLIAVSKETNFSHVKSLNQLRAEFNGLTNILELWFTNYKGPGEMESKGFGDEKEAKAILEKAVSAYK